MSGFDLWSDLCGSYKKPGECQGQMITCNSKSGLWELNPENKFDIAKYIDDSWDEGINCNSFSADVSHAITENMRKTFRNNSLNHKNQPCPVDPNKCAVLIESKWCDGT